MCVLPQEMKENGSHIRSALPRYERKVNFFGGWSSAYFWEWNIGQAEIDGGFGHYCGTGNVFKCVVG